MKIIKVLICILGTTWLTTAVANDAIVDVRDYSRNCSNANLTAHDVADNMNVTVTSIIPSVINSTDQVSQQEGKVWFLNNCYVRDKGNLYMLWQRCDPDARNCGDVYLTYIESWEPYGPALRKY